MCGGLQNVCSLTKNTKVISWLQTRVEILKCVSKKCESCWKKKRASRERDNADQLNSSKKRTPWGDGIKSSSIKRRKCHMLLPFDCSFYRRDMASDLQDCPTCCGELGTLQWVTDRTSITSWNRLSFFCPSQPEIISPSVMVDKVGLWIFGRV